MLSDDGLNLLRVAYAEELGKTGHALAGHSVIKETDVDSVLEKGQGSSLLYGELLPEGVVQLNEALFANRMNAEGPVLELGMGTGKVALQFFLSSGHHPRNVYGVELAPSRWDLAEVAIKRVAEADPARFRYSSVRNGVAQLSDIMNGTTCEIVCGSLLDTPVQKLASASAVVMEVCLPKEVQILACGLLQHCSTGCRVVCYAPLHGLVQNCRLAPSRSPDCACSEQSSAAPNLGDGMGGLYLPASWKPHGHGFAFYEVAESASAARVAWTESIGNSANEGCVEVDATGNPSRARRMRHTDDVLMDSKGGYTWGKGDQVLVGWSWLPFPDLGNPGDGSAIGLDGVTWMSARVVSVDPHGFATICYEDDGTVEEQVHPERIRQAREEGYFQERELPTINWGDDADFETIPAS